MANDQAPAIELGRAVIGVQWRDIGRDRGITITVEALSGDGEPAPVAKIDAFEEQPHWHQSDPDGEEAVEMMDDGDDAFARTYELLSDLPAMLRHAGQDDVAAELGEAQIQSAIDSVRHAVSTLTPRPATS